MKRVLEIVVLLAQSVFAGESSLTVTYQPLDGLGAGSIHIAQVTCHDWYSHSGLPTQIGLISAPNVPPTNNRKEAVEDLNLASACGVKFSVSGAAAASELTLEAANFVVPKRFDHSREQVLRASLECLRLCLPDTLRKNPVVLKCGDADRKWMSKVVADFNAHDRTKVFFVPVP